MVRALDKDPIRSAEATAASSTRINSNEAAAHNALRLLHNVHQLLRSAGHIDPRNSPGGISGETTRSTSKSAPPENNLADAAARIQKGDLHGAYAKLIWAHADYTRILATNGSRDYSPNFSGTEEALRDAKGALTSLYAQLNQHESDY